MTTTAGSPDRTPDVVGETRRFFPQLEGMRAIAALGVLTTHVAFQTRAVELPVVGPALGRLDLAVALFFGLSGFLLWRPWVAAAHTQVSRPSVGRYLSHRVIRIWPAYVVVVVLVLTLLPDAKNADLTVWLANLTLTQVFVPLSLTAGLTQMWSLSVEVAFYALLPLIGFALVRFRARDDGPGLVGLRIPALLGLGLLSLGWAWVAMSLPVPAGVEPKNWVFGHLPWFIAGLILAEVAGAIELHERRPVARWMRVATAVGARRWLMAAVLVVAYVLACTPLAGPTGLGNLSPLQFATKMVLGAVCGLAVLAPLVCSDGAGSEASGPARRRPFRLLTSSPMLALGRWSYGIFIWHLAVLAVVFPLFGIVPFGGDFLLVWTITVALTIGVSAAGYAFIEEPARRWLRSRETRRARTDGPSSVTNHTVSDTAIRAGS
ncbi:acyltransferase family protein [Gordonia sp. SID5947]|uniref:acyltransferase family protein n=1 Tax=Gordonia sp. SID5947 TaxID=2690315 RepID=UPI001369C5D4|nr:acyltransferase family protein [Gordonia sp. SID5947]